jgi:pyruvate formate lyase activating enzyme
MHALIFDIKHFAVHDGPGIRTTIFFKGCPLNCWWCHNPESISSKPETIQVIKKIGKQDFTEQKKIGKLFSIDQLITEIEKDNIFYEESGGGVTFSGGEPLFQSEFLALLAHECMKRKIHTTLDTSGYADFTTFKKISEFIDLFFIDIKLIDNNEHKRYTGVANHKIMQNLQYLSQTGKKVTFRYPVIPQINNKDEHIEQLINLARHHTDEIHLLPYHKIGMHKYKELGIKNKMKQYEELPVNYLNNLKEKIERRGFQVKIGG